MKTKNVKIKNFLNKHLFIISSIIIGFGIIFQICLPNLLKNIKLSAEIKLSLLSIISAILIWLMTIISLWITIKGKDNNIYGITAVEFRNLDTKRLQLSFIVIFGLILLFLDSFFAIFETCEAIFLALILVTILFILIISFQEIPLLMMKENTLKKFIKKFFFNNINKKTKDDSKTYEFFEFIKNEQNTSIILRNIFFRFDISKFIEEWKLDIKNKNDKKIIKFCLYLQITELKNLSLIDSTNFSTNYNKIEKIEFPMLFQRMVDNLNWVIWKFNDNDKFYFIYETLNLLKKCKLCHDFEDIYENFLKNIFFELQDIKILENKKEEVPKEIKNVIFKTIIYLVNKDLYENNSYTLFLLRKFFCRLPNFESTYIYSLFLILTSWIRTQKDNKIINIFLDEKDLIDKRTNEGYKSWSILLYNFYNRKIIKINDVFEKFELIKNEILPIIPFGVPYFIKPFTFFEVSKMFFEIFINNEVKFKNYEEFVDFFKITNENDVNDGNPNGYMELFFERIIKEKNGIELNFSSFFTKLKIKKYPSKQLINFSKQFLERKTKTEFNRKSELKLQNIDLIKINKYIKNSLKSILFFDTSLDLTSSEINYFVFFHRKLDNNFYTNSSYKTNLELNNNESYICDSFISSFEEELRNSIKNKIIKRKNTNKEIGDFLIKNKNEIISILFLPDLYSIFEGLKKVEEIMKIENEFKEKILDKANFFFPFGELNVFLEKKPIKFNFEINDELSEIRLVNENELNNLIDHDFKKEEGKYIIYEFGKYIEFSKEEIFDLMKDNYYLIKIAFKYKIEINKEKIYFVEEILENEEKEKKS